jgi:hypothetical protein
MYLSLFGPSAEPGLFYLIYHYLSVFIFCFVVLTREARAQLIHIKLLLPVYKQYYDLSNTREVVPRLHWGSASGK